MSYYRARYYDPQIGRFINEDPIAFMGSSNFYVYAGENPVNLADPRGLQECKKCGVKSAGYDKVGWQFGAQELTLHAEFLNDDTHSPSCCEVRQMITWIQGKKPKGSIPFRKKKGIPFEDRGTYPERYGKKECRYGYRPGSPYNCDDPGYGYSGNEFNDYDLPNQPKGTVLQFDLRVIDTCNGGSEVYSTATDEKSVTIKF